MLSYRSLYYHISIKGKIEMKKEGRLEENQEIIIIKKLKVTEVIETLVKEGVKEKNTLKNLEKVSKSTKCWYEVKISDKVIQNVLIKLISMIIKILDMLF